MITKKKLVVPIFEYKLTIIIFDDWRELEPYLPEEEFKVPAKAITLSQYGASMVMIDAKHGSSIVHEAVHVKNRYRGIIPSSATIADVYIAINAQYHDYYSLMKEWFGDNIDTKIIESAVNFWFKDDDYKGSSKVYKYFKEV